MKARDMATMLGTALLLLMVVVVSSVLGNDSRTIIAGETLPIGWTVKSPTSTVWVSTVATWTPVPTQTITVTAIPARTITPTSDSGSGRLAGTLPGYTFYGTQLEFLRSYFEWDYETQICEKAYVGVANVRVEEPENCVFELHYPDKERVEKYLFVGANYEASSEDPGLALPSSFRLYLYEGQGLDKAVNWGNQGLYGAYLLETLERYGFYSNVAVEFEACDLAGRPSVQRIIPLSEEEYGVVSSHSDLFPKWVEYCLIE